MTWAAIDGTGNFIPYGAGGRKTITTTPVDVGGLLTSDIPSNTPPWVRILIVNYGGGAYYLGSGSGVSSSTGLRITAPLFELDYDTSAPLYIVSAGSVDVRFTMLQ